MAEAQLDLLAPLVPDSEFLVRKSPRARHMAINIGVHGVVEIVVPTRTRAAAVQRFVQKHRPWIERTLREIHATHPGIEREMPERVLLPALGREWRVHYQAARFRDTGDVLELPPARADRPGCRSQLRNWLQRTARRELVPQLRARAAAMGMQVGRVQVRGQRTRWGSYSTSGTLSLNFCLLFLEPVLVDYLYVHELCHTRVMNHSRRFWQLVSQHEPRFRELERRLDEAWSAVPAWVSGPRG